MKHQPPIMVPAVDAFVEPFESVRKRASQRVLMLGCIFGVILVGIGVRGVQLCVQPDDRTIIAGSAQRWEQMTIRASRGDIFGRDGRSLASSVNTPNVVVDPSLIAPEDVESLATQVAEILDLEVAEVVAQMRKPTQYAKLAMRVHPQVAREVISIDHRAVFTESDSRRYYAEKGLAAHVLGFVDAGGEGKMGLEKSMEGYLKGSSVLLQRRRDIFGLDVDRFRHVDRTSPSGMDVHLTIDRQIQHYTEQAIAKVTEKFEPKGVMAVVVEVQTGDILALANTPSYNPNVITGDSNSRRNRSVQDAFEPGSVIKPFVMGAALEEGVVNPDSYVDCEGGSFRIGRSRIRDDHPHDVITASQVIKYSSNIGVAKIAMEMGAKTFLDYLADFGFGQKTEIPMPDERRGRLRRAETIKPIELATTAFGQGMTANAIQLAMATATVANDGVRMKPRLVTKIVDEYGVPAWIQAPEAVAQPLSVENARRVRDMMVSVTEAGGTGTLARVDGYQVAGKTGTAQKVTDRKYGAARIGSFVGFVPADAPKLAIVVVVDEPQGPVKYGGLVAGPAFAEIAGQSLAYLGVMPTKAEVGDLVSDEDAAVKETHEETDGTRFAHGDWTMPDLEGQDIRQALRSVQGLGFNLELQGSGTLTAQDPAPGSPVTPGSLVRLNFEQGF